MSDRIRLDGIDVGQLEHLRDELDRITGDLNENCETTRKLNDAVESISDAIEHGQGTTTDDWTPGNDRQTDSQTDPGDWEPK